MYEFKFRIKQNISSDITKLDNETENIIVFTEMNNYILRLYNTIYIYIILMAYNLNFVNVQNEL